MAKRHLKFKKEYVQIDFINDKFHFYNIYVYSVGFNQIEVIFHHGKLGNKGTRTIKQFSDYKQAMATAYQKLYEKKSQSFHNKEGIMNWLGQGVEDHSEPKRKSQKKPSKKPSQKCRCDECKKTMKQEVHDKVNEWARGQGNWDAKKDFVGYKKVLCIDCQFKHDIFKKRME